MKLKNLQQKYSHKKLHNKTKPAARIFHKRTIHKELRATLIHL